MAFFKFMAEWGLWDIIGLLAVIAPTLIVICYLFPRKSITNFYIDTVKDYINKDYPKVIRIKLRNHTNEPIYVLSEGFQFGNVIAASPYAAKDVTTGVCEVKFVGRQPGDLSEIDTIVRPNEEVSTWVPVDPSHSDQDIDSALKERQVGKLRLKCQRVSDRRHSPVRLRVRV